MLSWRIFLAHFIRILCGSSESTLSSPREGLLAPERLNERLYLIFNNVFFQVRSFYSPDSLCANDGILRQTSWLTKFLAKGRSSENTLGHYVWLSGNLMSAKVMQSARHKVTRSDILALTAVAFPPSCRLAGTRESTAVNEFTRQKLVLT